MAAGVEKMRSMKWPHMEVLAEAARLARRRLHTNMRIGVYILTIRSISSPARGGDPTKAEGAGCRGREYTMSRQPLKPKPKPVRVCLSLCVPVFLRVPVLHSHSLQSVRGPPHTHTSVMKKLKAQGNAAFTAGRFQDAVAHFSEALALEPGNHVLHSNRSAAQVLTTRQAPDH